MTLITGNALSQGAFFSAGNAKTRASSFDLTVGSIIDHAGRIVQGPFTLKPGHMVQVISAEVFDLPDSITGHVTYKTGLTRKGIWALTVGIVDPGWDGPISTTLLNFSKVPFAVAPGDTFLRVSFFDHAPVPAGLCTKAPSLNDYTMDLQKMATSLFSETFLNTDEITQKTKESVVEWIKGNALLWVAAAAGVLALVQAIAITFQMGLQFWAQDDVGNLRATIAVMESRIAELEAPPRGGSHTIPVPVAPEPSVTPTPPGERLRPPQPSRGPAESAPARP